MGSLLRSVLCAGCGLPQMTARVRARATLSRSVGLLSDFRYEQSRPDIFYSHLAADTVSLISDLWSDHMLRQQGGMFFPHDTRVLNGTRILDVGGGPGYFAQAFAATGADYYVCEPDVHEMSAAGITVDSSVRGSGLDLPFRDHSFDITYSSNVAEHVCAPWRLADEMLRVTRPGGLMIYSYTVWLGPFGGHETGMWAHYVGGEFAARRYYKKHGKWPKNRWGDSLFAVSVADGFRYARSVDADLVAVFPRYHPWWAWWLVGVPVIREFCVSNIVFVFRQS